MGQSSQLRHLTACHWQAKWFRMFSRAFAATCDTPYFVGLKALANSLYAYHGNQTPLFVYQYGFGQKEINWLLKHPLPISIFRISDFPYFPRGLWEAKQQVFAHCVGRAKSVFLLDVDIIVTSAMDDVWELAESGFIVAGQDGSPLTFGDDHAVYGLDLPGQTPLHVNSGAVCLDVEKHWDLAGLWAFASNFADYSPQNGFPLRLPGYGDQGHFNALLAMLHKKERLHVLPYRVWHECGKDSAVRIVSQTPNGALDVLNESTKEPQRILHAAGGSKWWTERGARHQSTLGDRLRCFHHFAEMEPGTKPTNGCENSGLRVGDMNLRNQALLDTTALVAREARAES